jgi:ABC-type multidrug transport system ATPase subunit
LSSDLIRVDAVTKKYAKLIAVDNVSLCVNAGEVYALVGANGAGKSTLIRILAGITSADEGKVFIDGQVLARGAHHLKRRIGYLPEDIYLYNRLSGSEYLQLVAGLKGADPASVAVEIEFFELGEVADKWIGGYSLGMRKKLGLAAAMIGAPDVLVLDEPLNGLDVEMMRRLRERIETERQAGRALLLSSHVMSFVERISNRVGIMSAGRLVAEGSPRELRDRALLVDAPFEDVFFKLAR